VIPGHSIRDLADVWRCLCGVVFAASTLAVAASSAQAVTPVPAWRVVSVPAPTAFSSNPQSFGACSGCADKYTILLFNVGARSSEGIVTVTDTLPAGLTTVATPGAENLNAHEWQCAPAGAGRSSVTCTDSVDSIGPNGGVASPLRIEVAVAGGVPSNSTLFNRVEVSGGGAAPVTIEQETNINPSLAPSFGVSELGTLFAGPNGDADTQAGSHPSSFTLGFDATSVTNTVEGEGHLDNPTKAVEDLKDVVVDLPPGLVGDPLATPRCPLSALVLNSTGVDGFGDSACPPDTRVGTVLFNDGGGYGGDSTASIADRRTVYNMVPERGYAAEFGFTFAGYPFLLYASVVGRGATTHVRVTVPGVPGVGVIPIQGVLSSFFGDPALANGETGPEVPFFTNPSRCSSTPLLTAIHLDSYENPGAHLSDGAPDLSDPAWKGMTAESPPLTGCEALAFTPGIDAQPTNRATDAPTGLAFHLHIPQAEEPETLGEADVKRTAVTLPEGLVVNPASAGGLAACSEEQIGLEDNDPAQCPLASQLGTVQVSTPLLDHPLPGSVYLATQDQNPFHSLVALYLVIDDPATGITVKLPGEVKPDPVSGRLTATFDETPQVPFEDFKLEFKKGQRAPLVTPSSCGSYTTSTDITPWSAPHTPDAQPTSTFAIDQRCATGGFSPSLVAGTSDPRAGAFTPFSLTFSRQDGERDLGGIEVTTPPGLLGDLRGVKQCPEPQAAHGECGPDSLLGEAVATVGAGNDPYTVTGGRVYLTGPYGGGPFGLSIIVPTVAGPFTLTGNGGFGREIVRSSIRVDPHTAQITVLSDPLPSILEGIPLQIRAVHVVIDRPDFMFNPTNCESASVSAKISSTPPSPASASTSSPFAVAGCASLPFNPSFAASTAGRTSKAAGASLTVTISQRSGEANIRKADLQLPLALPARLTTLQKACTEAQFAANPAGCPVGSDIGTAIATTPVLSSPLVGPAYLVSHGGAAFPDVEFVLQGEGVEVVLDGATDIKKGITYSRFETVPDAPISSFQTILPEGPHSALSANANLCGQRLLMPTSLTSQSHAVKIQTTVIAVTGCPKPSVKVLKARVSGGSVLVTVVTSQPGVVTIGGRYLRRHAQSLSAGTHRLALALTRSGRAARAHRRKTKIEVVLRGEHGTVRGSAGLKL
jgi:hypothetical protein